MTWPKPYHQSCYGESDDIDDMEFYIIYEIKKYQKLNLKPSLFPICVMKEC